MIVTSIIPSLVFGIHCLWITDLHHNSSHLHLPHPSPLLFFFHSLHSLATVPLSVIHISFFLTHLILFRYPHLSQDFQLVSSISWYTIEYPRIHQYPWFYGGYTKCFIYFPYFTSDYECQCNCRKYEFHCKRFMSTSSKCWNSFL